MPYADAKHEAEVEAMRSPRAGSPVVMVCPAHVFGRGDAPFLDRAVRRFLLRRILAYVDGAIKSSTSRSASGQLLCREQEPSASATSSATATSPSTACSPISARLSGVEAPASSSR